jgi:very-short-patch-repair endonuclease
MHCRYCQGEHPTAAGVRACWQRSQGAAELEQIRDHGLAVAGLGNAPSDNEERAVELRSAQTPSELRLGAALKKLPWKFLEQVPRFGYILDFYAPEISLAVEVDGASHVGRGKADRLRDDALAARGIRVLRVTAGDVTHDLRGVLRAIRTVGRKRQGKRDLQDLRDAEWTLYRYGPPEPQPKPLPPPTPPTVKPQKCKWKCLDCDRVFVAERRTPAKCRDNPGHKVRAICMRCNNPIATVPPLCDICRAAADVARASAGPGAHAPNDRLPQSLRAKRWRGERQ